MSPEPHKRAWREQPSFLESAKAIEPDVRRFDELCDAAKDIIENNAEACPKVGHAVFRLARAHNTQEEPIIGILFTIGTDDICYLWWVIQSADPLLTEEP